MSPFMSPSLSAGGHALGYADDSTSHRILINYTFAGDANLEGQVDVTDLGGLATNW